MKSLIILLTLISLSFADIPNKMDLAKDLDNLSYNQRSVLVDVYYSAKEKTKSKTESLLLTAIAWKESSFGEKLESSTGDYGTFQINLKTFVSRFGEDLKQAGILKHSKTMLKYNRNIGMTAALAELNYWKEKYNGDLDKVLSSYNAGHNLNAGKEYSIDVKQRMIILDSYLKLAQK